MKVAILGTGVVGQTLGAAFVATGHDVRMGSRHAHNENALAWAAKVGTPGAAGTFADVASFADLAVVATSWSGTENALALAGAERLAGKVVIDATNPLAFPAGGGPPGLALGHTDSAGEQVQRWLPDSHVVKAFNVVGAPHMFRPAFPDGPPDMWICGNDVDAKTTVTGILHDFGWPSVIDIGGIEGARLLEPLAILWVASGVHLGDWDIAFRLQRRG